MSVFTHRPTTSGDNSSSNNNNNERALKKWQDNVMDDIPNGNSNGNDNASILSAQRTVQMSNWGVADFFGPEIFQIVLHNPTTSHQLLRFSQSRMCGENMEFLEKVCFSLSLFLNEKPFFGRNKKKKRKKTKKKELRMETD